MELINIEINEKIAKITLDNGKVNAISHQLISEFNEALDQAEAAKAVVIFTGSPGILSGGYDLKVMMKNMESALALVTEGSKLTRRMLAFPYPIVAACPGHAIAKGAFLLLCSDYRVGVKGDYKIGLNEVKIGITLHYAGIEMARNRIPHHYFNRAAITAELFDPETAVLAGFLDKVVEEDQLMDEAENIAKQLATLNMKAHHGTKLKVREAYLKAMDNAIEVDAKGSL